MLNWKKILLLVCTLSLGAFHVIATTKVPDKVEVKIEKILSSSDSVISYSRFSYGRQEASIALLYKKKENYYYDYYQWKVSNDKIIKRTHSKKKSQYIKQIFSFVSYNFKELSSYSGFHDLSLTNIVNQMNDTATEGRRYGLGHSNHGTSIKYKIKFNNQTINTGTAYRTSIQYHIERFPSMGILLLLLNNIYLDNGYLLLHPSKRIDDK